MNEDELDLDFDELSSAEDFLEYFDITFDAKVVQVNRLHILQRYHDYLTKFGELPVEEAAKWVVCRDLLTKAYSDFSVSDAQTEKVFAVFYKHEPKTVSVDTLLSSST